MFYKKGRKKMPGFFELVFLLLSCAWFFKNEFGYKLNYDLL